MKKVALIIDHDDCWGCKTCEVACRQEFPDTGHAKLISVLEDGPRLAHGQWHFSYRVRVCMHCDEPPCMEVCPEEAILKRDDGMVVLDDERCTGCQACMDACPYGAIAYDPEGGGVWKCNLCHHRVDRGLLPACADNVCLAHCIHLGDPDGP